MTMAMRRATVSAAIFGPLSQHPPEWYPAHGFGYLLLENPSAQPDEAAWYAAALARFPTIREWPDRDSLGRHLTLLDTGLDLDGLAMQRRQDARFGDNTGDEIALLGHNVGPVTRQPGPPRPYFPPETDPPGAAPRPARPGDTLALTLLWRPLRQPTGDYLVFVHLRDANGRTVAQRDTRPQNNGYPTPRWRAGELVLDIADLDLPATLAPGRYTVVLGLYPPGRARLPVRASPDAAPLPDAELPLATVEVVP